MKFNPTKQVVIRELNLQRQELLGVDMAMKYLIEVIAENVKLFKDSDSLKRLIEIHKEVNKRKEAAANKPKNVVS